MIETEPARISCALEPIKIEIVTPVYNNVGNGEYNAKKVLQFLRLH